MDEISDYDHSDHADLGYADSVVTRLNSMTIPENIPDPKKLEEIRRLNRHLSVQLALIRRDRECAQDRERQQRLIMEEKIRKLENQLLISDSLM